MAAEFPGNEWRALYEQQGKPAHLVRWLESLIEAGRVAQALEAAQREQSRFPRYSPLVTLIGRCQFLLGQLDAAKATIQRAIDLDATYARAWETLLEISIQREEWDTAYQCLETLELLGWESDRLDTWRQQIPAHVLESAESTTAPMPTVTAHPSPVDWEQVREWPLLSPDRLEEPTPPDPGWSNLWTLWKILRTTGRGSPTSEQSD